MHLYGLTSYFDLITKSQVIKSFQDSCSFADVMVQRDCKSSSGCCGFKKEKHILSMPGELSEGSNFAVLGEVELEGTRELVLAIYKNYQVITYIWVAEPTRETV